MTQKTASGPSNPFNTPARPAAGTPARPGTPAAPLKPPTPAPPRPAFNPGGTLSRFGQARTTWEIWPFSETLVRFSLEGLGGSLDRVLGSPLVDSAGTYDLALQSIEKNQQALLALSKGLDDAWEQYHLCGAMLVFSWMQDTRQIILSHAKASGLKAVCLRALDPILVLNVLARTRTNLLQPRAPLAFDKSYLERSLISTDARLVRLVQASGYFEEVIPDETKSEEELEE